MFLPEIILYLAKLVYPLPEPPRKSKNELKVVALGLPRSGTESLCRALKILGYSNVSHGYIWWSERAETSELWYRLGKSRSEGRTLSKDLLREEYFDRILGEYDATTDIPAAWFAPEVLAAYPNAKVILNRRRDVQDWKRSFREAILPLVNSWAYWIVGWLNAEWFWLQLLTNTMHCRELFRGDFEKIAESTYVQHYENLEAIMRRDEREWLDWSVEDGWYESPILTQSSLRSGADSLNRQPLCSFLNVPVPNESFPSGNVAADFAPKLAEIDAARFRRVTLQVLGVAAAFTTIMLFIYTSLSKIFNLQRKDTPAH